MELKAKLDHIAEPLRGMAVAIETLRQDPENARRHPERNIEAIANSLRRFGQRRPVVVQSGTMVVRAGNGLIEAARRLGWTHVAAITIDEDDATASAFAIADNRTAELAEWDASILLDALETMDPEVVIDLEFTFKELDELRVSVHRDAASGRATHPDEVPPPPKDPITKPGDLWILGAHRLLCGDATNPNDVRRLMEGTVPAMMVTDPPYGVEYDPEWRERDLQKGKKSRTPKRGVANDDIADWSRAFRLFEGDIIYAWSPPGTNLIESGLALRRCGFEIRNQIIWSKTHFPIGRGHYHYRHEPCWYAVRKGGKANWIGDRKQNTVWEMSLDTSSATGHPTQKPVEAILRAIRNHEARDVADWFAGSGTTLIACEHLQRRCFAMEIEPVWCDVIVARWEAYIGKKAERIPQTTPTKETHGADG